MSQLCQVVLAHALDQLELVLQAFPPDTFDSLAAGGRQPSAHGAAVLRVGHALDEAVALQVVDEAGDIPWRRVELVRQIAEWAVTDAEQPEHDAQAALAQVVFLSPALLHHAQRLAGDPQGGQGLHGRRVDPQRLQELPHPGAVEAAGLVAAQFVDGGVDLVVLHIGFMHSELLHYSLIQEFAASYSPNVIVDAHLDIGWNAIASGRGFSGEPAKGYVVSRSALERAGVGLIFATLYTSPARARRTMRTRFVYENAHEANLMATAQVNYYATTGLQFIHGRRELAAYVRGWRQGRVAAVMLMEGADPIEPPAQLGSWVERGVRIIGPAWGRTRYSGGTGAPGGLTVLGVQLLKSMRRHKVILDLSHMAEEAVADAFELWRGPIMASHSNARELVPGDRQITNATAAEIGRRGGGIGIPVYPAHPRPKGPADPDDVGRP